MLILTFNKFSPFCFNWGFKMPQKVFNFHFQMPIQLTIQAFYHEARQLKILFEQVTYWTVCVHILK